eukprot:scaffold5321_cov366-Prasinococcus_capsulatus_cf.AAC.14
MALDERMGSLPVEGLKLLRSSFDDVQDGKIVQYLTLAVRTSLYHDSNDGLHTASPSLTRVWLVRLAENASDAEALRLHAEIRPSRRPADRRAFGLRPRQLADDRWSDERRQCSQIGKEEPS